MLAAVLIGLIAVLVMVYLLGKNNERYWKKRGVKFHNKNKLTGVFWDFITKRSALFKGYSDLYHQYKNEPAVGIGSFSSPSLFVVHPKNVQHVLQADFNSFNHRGVDISKEEKLFDNILFMNGPRWKLMRQSMSPLFTAAKLKNMYYIIDRCAQDLIKYIKDNPKTCEGNNFELLMTYCNASVCGAIFGIGTESIFDSPFLKVATKFTAPTLVNSLKFALMTLSPTFSNFLGIRVLEEYEEFLISAITNVIQQREKENVKKHDFADLCVSLQKNGTLRDPTTGTEIEPTYEILTAQATFFLSAGVEPVAVSIFAALIELGRHPDILERVHREVDECFNKHGKNLSYDAISELTYIDQVLSEAMRINPPIGYLSRRCVKDSVLPVGNIKIDKGTNMYTPIYDIHHNPDFYPEPHVFDPERFAPGKRPNDDIYMPFGLGGRMCIGARFSKLQTAAGFVHLLRHFTIKLKEFGGPKTYSAHFNMVRRTDVDIQLIPRSQFY